MKPNDQIIMQDIIIILQLLSLNEELNNQFNNIISKVIEKGELVAVIDASRKYNMIIGH